MNGNIWVLASAYSVAIATTLILAALGALFTERAGVLNLGIEGILLTSAISSFLAADSSGSIWLGLIVGSLVGALLAGIHAVLSVVLRANQIVAGLALVIFGTGLANFLGKPAEGKTVTTIIKPISFGPLSDIPLIGPVVFQQDPITYASIVIAILASLYLFRSRPGLELRATGDDPATVDAQGLSVASIRLRYTLFGWLLVGSRWLVAHACPKRGMASGSNNKRCWLDCTCTGCVCRMAPDTSDLRRNLVRLHFATAVHIAGRTNHVHSICTDANASVLGNVDCTDRIKSAKYTQQARSSQVIGNPVCA